MSGAATDEQILNASADMRTFSDFMTLAADAGLIQPRTGTAFQPFAFYLAQVVAAQGNYDTLFAALQARQNDIDAIIAGLQPGEVLDEIFNNLPALVDVAALGPEGIQGVLDAITAAELRITGVEAAVSGAGNIVARLNRLDELFPPAAPVWQSLPSVEVLQGEAMTPFDLNPYVSDADSSVLVISATGLPAGLSVVNGILQGTTGDNFGAVFATITATDPGGRTADASLTVNIADPAAPPPAKPVWTAIPAQTVLLGDTITPINYDSYLSIAGGSAADLSLTISGQPAGTGLVNHVLSGRPNFARFHTVTVTAFTAQGTSAPVMHTIDVQARPPRPDTGGGGGGGGGTGGGFEFTNTPEG